MHCPSLRQYYVYKGAPISFGNGYPNIQRAVFFLLDKRKKRAHNINMKISVSSFLAFSTLIYHSTLATTLKPSRKDTLESWNSVQARHLSPAYPHGGLRKRQLGKMLRNEARLDFVDHFTHVTARSNDPVLYATLNMRSNHPVLSIEDLEDGLVDVTCSEEGIKLTFSTSQYMEQVSKELGNTDEFVAISSHWGCNEKEERAPHM